MVGLGLWVAAGAWLFAIQLMLALWDPLGTWQLPRIFKISITQVSRDTERRLTGQVLGLEGDKERDLTFAKDECAELEGEDETWVLQNYRADGNRPSHFRLTPARLVLEYPEPWMLLALWGISRLRRRERRMAQEELPKERKVWRDEFHQRSERFSQPKDPGAE